MAVDQCEMHTGPMDLFAGIGKLCSFLFLEREALEPSNYYSSGCWRDDSNLSSENSWYPHMGSGPSEIQISFFLTPVGLHRILLTYYLLEFNNTATSS